MRLMMMLLLASLSVFVQAQTPVQKTCAAMFNTEMRLLHSDKSVNLCDVVKNHAVLVVNTASHCGFTPQFKGLEKLHQTYKDKGLVVLGFASDDFYQEDDSESEAAKICYVNFGVTFTMLAPSHVKGDKANKVFAAINKQSKAPSWNFNKYLIDANGTVLEHFGSRVKPDDIKLAAAIEAALNKK
jgi:glutathione peroxidase